MHSNTRNQPDLRLPHLAFLLFLLSLTVHSSFAAGLTVCYHNVPNCTDKGDCYEKTYDKCDPVDGTSFGYFKYFRTNSTDRISAAVFLDSTCTTQLIPQPFEYKVNQCFEYKEPLTGASQLVWIKDPEMQQGTFMPMSSTTVVTSDVATTTASSSETSDLSTISTTSTTSTTTSTSVESSTQPSTTTLTSNTPTPTPTPTPTTTPTPTPTPTPTTTPRPSSTPVPTSSKTNINSPVPITSISSFTSTFTYIPTKTPTTNPSVVVDVAGVTLSLGAIIGIAAGGVALLTVVCGIGLYYCVEKRRKRNQTTSKGKYQPPVLPTFTPSDFSKPGGIGDTLSTKRNISSSTPFASVSVENQEHKSTSQLHVQNSLSLSLSQTSQHPTNTASVVSSTTQGSKASHYYDEPVLVNSNHAFRPLPPVPASESYYEDIDLVQHYYSQPGANSVSQAVTQQQPPTTRYVEMRTDTQQPTHPINFKVSPSGKPPVVPVPYRPPPSSSMENTPVDGARAVVQNSMLGVNDGYVLTKARTYQNEGQRQLQVLRVDANGYSLP